MIFPKTVRIFPDDFLNFPSDMILKQGIISLASYSNKSHASLSLSLSLYIYIYIYIYMQFNKYKERLLLYELKIIKSRKYD